MTQMDRIFSLLRSWQLAVDAKLYSHARCYETQLLEAMRATPEWALPPLPLEPAAEVERELACGTKLTLRNEDGHLVIVVRDDETTLAPVLTPAEEEQLRRDIARVQAAQAAGKAA